MKKFFIDIALCAVALCIVAALVATLATMFHPTEGYHERIEREFRAACEATNGKAVWSGRAWECLK